MDAYLSSLLSIKDCILPPLYIIFIFLIAFFIKSKHEKTNAIYSYFLLGLFVKLFASIAFCLIYIFYYGGGDTLSYFEGGLALNNLMFENFGHYLEILIGQADESAWAYFSTKTGYPPWYMWKDPHTFFVCRIVSPIMLISGNSFFTTSIVLAAISYIGSWKLFQFFNHFYPDLKNQIAISVLFFPSVIFWGSGILKDTFTLFASCWLIYAIFKVFILKQQRLTNFVIAIIMAMIIIKIKPYILLALTPGIGLWISFQRIKSIQNKLVRFLFFPSVIFVSFLFISILFSFFASDLGAYASVDSIIQKAQVTQDDLTRAHQYGENYYNIGTIDGSMGGFLKLAPKAIIAGLFRPFLWDAKNIVLLISGLENTFLLIFTLLLLFKSGLINFFKTLFSEPVVMFSFVFAIIFLMSVGMASANYGAMVRYKIPALPFFMMSLFIVNYLKKKEAKAL